MMTATDKFYSDDCIFTRTTSRLRLSNSLRCSMRLRDFRYSRDRIQSDVVNSRSTRPISASCLRVFQRRLSCLIATLELCA